MRSQRNFETVAGSSSGGSRKSAAARHALARAVHSPVEALEARRLLTTASIISSELVITGTSGAETIEVYQKSSNGKVTVYSDSVSLGEFTVANFNLIRVSAGGSADTVRFGSTLWGTGSTVNSAFDTPVSKPAVVNGEAGNDTVYGTDQADTIDGGTGNDWLSCAAGNDTAYGRTGDDTMFGDSANDVLWGDDTGGEETGADTIDGGTQDDHCYGGAGDDSLDGAAGNDQVWGDDPAISTVSGYDTLRGGTGNDTLRGGPGDDDFYTDDGEADTIEGGSGSDWLQSDGNPPDTWSSIER